MKQGTRIVKVASEPADAHPDGSMGTIIFDMGAVGEQGAANLHAMGVLNAAADERFYFVEWDDLPGVPVGVRGAKLRIAAG